MDLVGSFFTIFNLITLALILVSVFAFIDALTRRADAFVAAGKLTKPIWATIVGVSALVFFLWGFWSFFSLPAMVAVMVYFVDVRPAVRGIVGDSRGSSGSSGSW